MIKKYKNEDVMSFLDESNKIEDIFDKDSLRQAKVAWDYLIRRKDFNKFNKHVILKTHKILMLNQKLQPDEKGYFRTIPVWVGNKEALNHKKIQDAIDQWLKWMKITISRSVLDLKENIEELIKNDHVEFERIHPFVDGNGRVGRMFMNWERMQCGLPIHIIYAKNRHSYYEWFH